MQLVGIQPNTVWEDKAASHARVEALLRSVRVEPGALVVLPEMFATGFSVELPAVVEAAGSGESQRFLSALAARLRAYVVGGVVTDLANGRGANEAVVYEPEGGEVTRYRKLHPFTFGGETAHYDAGDRLVSFEWQGAKVAPLICYDLRFPEAFRAGVTRGAAVFVVIANWPAERDEHWLALLQARAIENQAYVIGVNRCGRAPKLSYAGGSRVIDPKGRLLAEAGSDEAVIEAEVDLAGLLEYRRTFPALADARSDLLPS